MIKHPCYKQVVKLIMGLRAEVFSEYFASCHHDENLKTLLFQQINIVLNDEKLSQIKTDAFFDKLPVIKEQLHKDAQAGFENDPACECVDEIILAYPGMFAISIYRFAHLLYELKIPLLPRMMSEYAHSKTGIDIHPGAQIGNSFFIDHGTGVVIGETCIIKDNVKIYQGVTLGAISLKGGQKLRHVKRHPTIENNVTIYANATILGGDTIIGENSIIGGNTFILNSVAANSKVLK